MRNAPLGGKPCRPPPKFTWDHPPPPFLYRSVLRCTGKPSCKNVVLQPRARAWCESCTCARVLVLVQEPGATASCKSCPRARAWCENHPRANGAHVFMDEPGARALCKGHPRARAILVQELPSCKGLVLELSSWSWCESRTCEGSTVVQGPPSCKGLVLKLNVRAALVQGPGARATLVPPRENLVLQPRARAARV